MADYKAKAHKCDSDRDYLLDHDGTHEYKSLLWNADESMGIFTSEIEIDKFMQSTASN